MDIQKENQLLYNRSINAIQMPKVKLKSVVSQTTTSPFIPQENGSDFRETNVCSL